MDEVEVEFLITQWTVCVEDLQRNTINNPDNNRDNNSALDRGPALGEWR